MPLQVLPLEEADIPAFAIVDDLAMANWGLARAMMHGTPLPRRELVEGIMRSGWGKDPAQSLLKVVDDETGEIVACAMWRVQTEESDEQLDARGAAMIRKALNPHAGATGGVEGGEGTVDETGKKSGPPSMMGEMGRQWEAFRAETFGSAPHAHLQILVTHPAHQRRGAGSLLVKWGCDRADEVGVVAVLMASAAGLHVYEKAGFLTVKTSELDLQPWGVDEVELRRAVNDQAAEKARLNRGSDRG
ncbi:hypothetical protein B0A48_07943 [Cryoendolithus antarcticus]|uniref:N-acetyltransferase domain-containing protein n=1 Tax=Cryoendolithus antarcticus TaxID=1507870 RepID=A0A1V8T0H8_9PEZI|nr:hypothetical protein B0A48_07943 [Cryoendolithus antarcticus]